MAMLAEPRRRQKLSFDPRNKAWSDDSSKFGQKLMEKMGWSKGKGLGVKEDGQLSHIKVSLKNNTLGVGCKASQEDNWIAHQDDFNDLLSSLNQNHGGSATDGKPSQSLEERSKKSKSRVHYKKFTRGKDLTRYGKEGMNSILGRRLTQSAPVTPQSQSVENSDQEDENGKEELKEKETEEGTEELSHGVVTIKGACSVGEYFAQKMAALKRARQRTESESHSDTELDPPRCGFGFRQAAETDGNRAVTPEDRAGPSGIGRPGESARRMAFVAAADCEDGDDDREDGGAENEVEEEREMESEEGMDGHRERSSGKKKKKRKKKRMRNTERDSDDNDAVIEIRGQSENEEDEGIEIDRKKKKNKKKKRLVDEVTVESKSESASEQNGGDDCEKKRKKKTKKSKKDKNRNEVIAEHSCSIDDDTSEERSGGETSRKRKCDSNEESLEDERDETTSSRKKRKKDKGEKGEIPDGGESSLSKKKKKKKQKM